ncbi:hypothetical protein [Herbaspirillum sp.]|uniref:hypothetical protein n=1 Tax=Herbaspirillum sp. TaxID=1890675 RepID=UPI0031E39515
MIAIHTPGFSRIGAKREVDADRRQALSAINGRNIFSIGRGADAGDILPLHGLIWRGRP